MAKMSPDASPLRALEERLSTASDPAMRRAALLRIVDEVRLSDPTRGLELADRSLSEAIAGHDMAAAAEAYLYRGLCRQMLARASEGERDLHDAFVTADELGIDRISVPAAIGLATAYEERNDPAEAIKFYTWGLQRAELACDLTSAALASTGLGELFTTIGDYVTAIGHHYRALAACQDNGDDAGTGAALHAIGIVHGLAGDYDASLNFVNQSLTLLRSGGNPELELTALTNLGAIHAARDELGAALDCELRALAAYEALGNTEKASGTLLNLAMIHDRKDDVPTAIAFNLRALEGLREDSSATLRCAALLNLGGLYTTAGSVQDASFILGEALAVARELGHLGIQAEAHARLTACCERSGDIAGALAHERQRSTLRENLAGVERQRMIAALRINNELDRAERDRECLRKRIEQLESEVQRSQHELKSSVLSLVQKNEILELMRVYLRRARREPDNVLSAEANELLRLLETTADAGEEWARFHGQLDVTNREFARRLSEKYPELSVTELKICSLAILDLSTKEIASLLNASVRTVETHRYHIRRKLGLGIATSLAEFLSGI